MSRIYASNLEGVGWGSPDVVLVGGGGGPVFFLANSTEIKIYHWNSQLGPVDWHHIWAK